MEYNMDALTLLLLSHLVFHKPPGRSPYSFEVVPECGINPSVAECELKRTCDIPAFWCAKPRWSDSRSAWTRIETKETGLKRYAKFSDLVVKTVRGLTRCVDSEGVAVESCERVRWWNGSQDLSLVIGTLAIFEAGLAEGPMYGHPPLGRGADGEVCMLGVMPQYAPKYATWLPKEERDRLYKSSYKEIEEWAIRDLHGSNNLERCLEVSIREIVAHKRACKSDFGMFSAYASGKCNSSAKTVPLRMQLLNRLRASKPELPEWAKETLGVT